VGKFAASIILSILLAPNLLRADVAPGASPLLSPAATVSPAPAASSAVSGSAAPTITPPPPIIAAGNFPVVAAQSLIALLPDPPPGWKSDKPDGQTSDSSGFRITTVNNVYVQGDADNAPTTEINIIDSANNQQFQDATKAIWGATSNTPQGYDKTLLVDGLSGFEHYRYSDQTGVLWVIVGGRYFVQIETTRQKPAELEAWLPRIDLKKLAALR
jgi:hypothetical protein